MIDYVAGLVFSKNSTVLALIRKNRPEWQAGKLNAIGGKIELGETPLDAMIRECKEEAGIEPEFESFLCLHGFGFRVHFFRSFTDAVYKADTITDEEVVHVITSKIPLLDTIPNLKWIIPLAMDKDAIFADVEQK